MTDQEIFDELKSKFYIEFVDKLEYEEYKYYDAYALDYDVLMYMHTHFDREIKKLTKLAIECEIRMSKIKL